jgi:hypothetical protein
MSSKQELVEQIVGLLVAGAGTRLYGPNSVTVTPKDRAFLERSSVSFLETKARELQSEVAAAARVSPEVERINEDRRRQRDDFLREQALAQIFRTPINGKVAVDNQAARQIIEGWLSLDEKLRPEWFAKVLAEQPSLARSLSWQSADLLDPRRQKEAAAAQAVEDRKIFESTAKRCELYSINEANWNVVHSTLGPGLSEYQIQQAVSSGAVRLTPATPSEIQEWRQQAAEERASYLAHHASPVELRRAANEESEQRRVAAAQQQADSQLQAAIARDAVMGYPPLPDTWQGEKLDAAFIKNCSVETHKLLSRRFGSAALDLRLRGLK